MIDLREHAARSPKERARRLGVAKVVREVAAKQHAEFLLAEAAVIVLGEFGDEVARIIVQTSPCQISLHGQAIITEVMDADDEPIWSALGRGEGAGRLWAGEGEAAELITQAWGVSSEAFRPVDEHKGLYEIRLHRAAGARS
ncbi:hypothetical protein [Micromonospora maritima]|uniref:hypothetical protein n=1 Tax=Micromonospora maritima TaxID=986711 RepID=UPI00157D2F2A|nr:hypothetical protein [Micromonospora maritima]